MGNKNIICDEPFWNESRLILSNYIIQPWFQPFSKDLRDDFINDIGQTDRSVILYCSRVLNLWYERYMGLVNLRIQSILLKENLNKRNET